MDKWTAKLTIAYHGANYVGWQLQKNGVSVQQKLEEAWTELTGEQTRITASGRTDSGVHAFAQVCSLHTETKLLPHTLMRALNAKTPEDICVIKVEKAVDDFHAIRDATGKTYHYRIQFGSPLSPHELGRCWYVPRRLDLESMEHGANMLRGKHDFASFETKGSPRNSTVRTIRRLDLVTSQITPFKFLTLEIEADGFLYNMARTIAGTLVEVGQGSRSLQWLRDVLASRNRKLAGMTAPAHGLYLMRVEYRPEQLDL